MCASTCLPCPEDGVRCEDGSSITILAGWYMASPHDATYRCATARACEGGRDAFDNRTCAAGYSGILCGRCVEQYYRARRQCLSCLSVGGEDADVGLVLWPLLLAGALVLLIAAYLRPPSCGATGNLFRRVGKTF